MKIEMAVRNSMMFNLRAKEFQKVSQILEGLFYLFLSLKAPGFGAKK